jgi:PAS domain S-box-containing protein
VNSIPKRLLQYVLSLAAVATAVIVRWILDPLLGDYIPYATFFAAVAVASCVGGLGPALLAIVVGCVAVQYFFVPPRFSFTLSTGPHLLGSGMYVIVSLIIAGIGEAMRVAQRRFAEQAERLRTTLASIGEAVITTDMAGCITNMNAVAESLTGWTTAEAMGLPLDAVFRIVNETTRHTVENPVTRALTEGIIVGLATPKVLIAKNGTECPIDDSAAPIRRANGEVVGCVLVFRDIGERYRKESERKKSEQQFRTLAESIPQLAWMANTDGHIFWYNRRWYDYTGTTLEQMEGWGWQSVHDPKELPKVLERWNASITTSRPFDMTFPLKGRDGQFRPFLTRVEPVKDDEGRVVRWFGTNTDITARQEVEDLLRRSDQFNRSLMDGTADCVTVLDICGRLLHMNTPGQCLMEIEDPGHLFGQEWRALWSADVWGNIERSLAQALGGEVSAFQAYSPTAKGTPKWWDVTVSPVRDADGGQVVRLLAVSRDITKRKEVEDHLRASEAEFRAAFEQSAVGMAQVDAKTGRIIRANAKYCEVTGYPGEELAEMTPTDLTFTDDRGADDKAFGPVLRGEVASYDREKRYRRKDGQIIWVRVNATLLRDVEGRPERTMAVIQEITRRKEAEAAVRESNERVTNILASITDAFITLNREWQFTYLNQRAQEILSLGQNSGESLLGKNHWQNFPDLIGTPVEENYRRCMVEQVTVSFEMSNPPLQGWFEVRAYPSKDGISVYFQDITVQKLNQLALHDSERRMRLATETTQVGIWEWNVTTGEVRWDTMMFQIYGIPPTPNGVVQYCDWSESVLLEDLPHQEALLHDTIQRLGSSNRHFRIKRRNDGECRDINCIETVRTNEKGNAQWVVGTNLDVTERKRGEEALRASEERYRAATAAVSDLIWTNNADGLMVGEQRGWQEFTGQSYEEYQGYGWSKAIHPEDSQPTIEAWTRAVAEKGIFDFEHRVRRHDGQWRICSVRAVPILHANGSIREWVGVHADITERKGDEETLRQLAAELAEAHHRKDEFLATLAHELRNPLAPIRNGLQLMKLVGGQNDNVEQARSMMERQLAQMVRLIDDLMDVSRISRGKLELRKECVPMDVVLNSAVETSRPLIEQMGHELTVTLPDQPLIVDADMTRLAQVFLNLLNNAAKYSDRGGHIQLNVEHQGSDVVVTVKDTGIGIAADQLTRIFEMFTQVDRSLDKSHGGLGIGLTLVKRLVEMHGGRVEAKSRGPGKGSEFIVRLPVLVEASRLQAWGVEQDPASPKSSLRILIVDDNRDGADSLAMMLRIMGNDTRTAYEGQEGVDVAGEFRPEVLLLDIGLPKLNGYEACRNIREQAWGKGVVMIAMTGWGQDDDRRRSHEAGFDHHLVKPVDPQELMKMLAGLSSVKA